MLLRRDLLRSGLAVPLATMLPGGAYGQMPPPILISDMHFHSFFGDSVNHSRPVGRMLAEGQATLVSWAVAGDALWVDRRTLKQTGEPKPGEAFGWLMRELDRIKRHMAEQGLKPALAPGDIDAALAGDPHIVLSVEGASFVEANPGRLRVAYDAGVRHIQLVHFVRNTLGDFQTEPPEHDGLTGLGREVIAECNRLGILVDLAHATPTTVRAALAVSKAPMIWSHGSVTAGPAPHPGLIIWRARQLPLAEAKAIAAAGGVVGLWALTLDVGKTVEDYARRLLEIADWLGDEHAAFGTDINGLGPNFILRTYAELRRAVEIWQRQGVPDQRIRKIAGLNYARVLKAAMSPARPNGASPGRPRP